MKVSFRAPP
jgi:hypothetical protein